MAAIRRGRLSRGWAARQRASTCATKATYQAGVLHPARPLHARGHIHRRRPGGADRRGDVRHGQPARQQPRRRRAPAGGERPVERHRIAARPGRTRRRLRLDHAARRCPRAVAGRSAAAATPTARQTGTPNRARSAAGPRRDIELQHVQPHAASAAAIASSSRFDEQPDPRRPARVPRRQRGRLRRRARRAARRGRTRSRSSPRPAATAASNPSAEAMPQTFTRVTPRSPRDLRRDRRRRRVRVGAPA